MVVTTASVAIFLVVVIAIPMSMPSASSSLTPSLKAALPGISEERVVNGGGSGGDAASVLTAAFYASPV